MLEDVKKRLEYLYKEVGEVEHKEDIWRMIRRAEKEQEDLERLVKLGV